ncbi:MAG: serine/threonine-protein kinase [Polyangiaceae bacterium]
MGIAPGAFITSNIELVTPIAEGAMGSVWVAYHHRLQTRVAVKFVSDKLGEDTPEALARFEREASTASQIKSSHVVQTFDSGVTVDGEPFMVMELLEGESLGNRLRRGQLLSLGEGATILAQIARALMKAHALGIVHRDIKPDNIFLCHDQEGLFCKILDFGIAKQTRLPSMGGLTTEGKMVGTPEYLSPEQVLDGAQVDYRADLWGLTVTLYTSLTGRLPFSGRTLGQLCLALASCRHQPPSAHNPQIPSAVDDWFQRALSRQPGDRFDNARDMAVQFAAALPAGDKGVVDLGGATFLGLADSADGELSLATAAATMPGRRLSRIGGPVFAIALTALGIAGFVVMSTPTTGAAIAHSSLSDTSDAAAAAARGQTDTPDATAPASEGGDPQDTNEPPIDLDEPDDATPSPTAPPAPLPAAPPAPPKPADPPPQVEVVEPPPPPPPPPPAPASNRRGESELGF